MSEIDKALKLKDENQIIIKVGEIIFEKIKKIEDFNNINETLKTFLYIDILEEEVNNGGFDQYFFNSSGEYAHETLKAYEKIGAKKTADIIYRAIKLFPTLPIPKDLQIRREILLEKETNTDLWNELDDEFYKYEDSIGEMIIEFLKKNKAEFE